MLSDEKIGLLAIRAINAAGCKAIKATVPFGTEVVPMVRHILGEYESAACAERDARIAELERELEQARKDAIPAMRAYAAKNPRFLSHEDVVQDPNGVHAWLEKHAAAIKEQA